MRYCFSLFLLVLGMEQMQAQSFHRGALVFDLNTGLELYETESIYRAGNRDTMAERLTGNSNYALGIEAGIGKRIGIGLRGKANIFYRALDQVTNNRPDIRSNDLMLMINLHPVARKRFDLVLGAEFGLSNLYIDVNNLAGSVIDGRGGYYALYLNPRFYFGRLGLNLKTYIPFVSYKNLVADEQDPAEYLLSRWKGSGFGISLGLQLRLF